MSLYYFQVNALCLIVLAIVLAIFCGGSVMPTRRKAFIALVIVSMLICVSDVVAWFFHGTNVPGGWLIVQLSNLIYYLSITVSAYAWLIYVELRVHSLGHDFSGFKRFSAVPMLLMGALLVVNIFTGFIFKVDENNVYERANGIVIHWIISWGYLLFATVEVVLKMLRCNSRVERQQFVAMLGFICPPAFAAVLQMVFYGITSTQCGMTVSILVIAVQFLTEEVSKDSLTGLNNRRALEGFLIDRLHRGVAGLSVLMCDVDRFKEINDTYGHSTGDLVLKNVGTILKNVCAEESGKFVLCRYGGDEFLICASSLTQNELPRLSRSIESKVEALNEDTGKGPALSISIGSAAGICYTYDDVEKLIAKADNMMYNVKALRESKEN